MEEKKKKGDNPGKDKSIVVEGRKLTPDEIEKISNNFTYHAPFGDQPKRYEFLRNQARKLAQNFCSLCPPSRELSLALTKLEEAVFWVNAAIARNETNAQNS